MNFGSPLEAWGLPGFFILVLAGVVIYLYKDRDKWISKYIELQDARTNDVKESRDKVAGPLELISEQQKLIYNKLVDGK